MSADTLQALHKIIGEELMLFVTLQALYIVTVVHSQGKLLYSCEVVAIRCDDLSETPDFSLI